MSTSPRLLLAIGALAAFCACRTCESTPPTPVEDVRPDFATLVSAPELERHARHLASDGMRGRPTPSQELDDAAKYIAVNFEAAGLSPLPGQAGYFQRFDCSGTSTDSSNVLGWLPGSDPARRNQAILVTAHYDHIGTADPEAGGDAIYNGANDNASGVAALLNVAHATATRPPARSLVFIAFCGEELGLRGSQHYVKHPAWPIEHTIAVVNLEMLGRATPAAPTRAWFTGFELSDLPEVFERAGGPHGVEFVSSQQIGPVEGNAFSRSDNYPFALAGVVAHTIAAGTLDEYYHAVHDDPSTLDYPRMAAIVRSIAAATYELAESTQQPAWTEDGIAAGYASGAPSLDEP